MCEEQLKTVARLTAVFAAVSLAVCLWRAATKPVVIAGTAQAKEQTQRADAPPEEIYDAKVLTLVPRPAAGAEDDLTIPLPAGMRSEDVRTENYYLSRQLWITLRTARGNYDKEGAEIAVNPEKVREGASVRTERSAISLRFGLTGLYEPTVSLAEGVLHVRLQKPKERYERIVLVDPFSEAADGAEELPAAESADGGTTADAALRAAQEFSDLYDGDDQTHIYLTRLGAEQENRAAEILRETEADLCVRICAVDEAFAGGGLRLVYNDAWYLRKYTNAAFARDLADALAKATGIGIAEVAPDGEEDPLLSVCAVPGVAVYLPLSAAADGEVREEISAQIAQGIREAVDGAFAAIDGEAGD